MFEEVKRVLVESTSKGREVPHGGESKTTEGERSRRFGQSLEGKYQVHGENSTHSMTNSPADLVHA